MFSTKNNFIPISHEDIQIAKKLISAQAPKTRQNFLFATQLIESAWTDNCKELLEQLEHSEFEDFLSWRVIKDTMCVRESNWSKIEFENLAAMPDWLTRWKPAIRESTLGKPAPLKRYRATSANLVHHAYHISQFESSMDFRLCDFDVIIEFGGGYGSACRLAYQLGFNGEYNIFDLPPFLLLQEAYLTALGLNLPTQGHPKSRLKFVSDLELLEKPFADRKKVLFLATWSLSESPVSVRREFQDVLMRSDALLIAFQQSFESVDNQKYFLDIASARTTSKTEVHPISFLKKNFYLMSAKQ